MSYIQGSYKGPGIGVGIVVAVVLLSRCVMVAGSLSSSPAHYASSDDVERDLFANAGTGALYRTLKRTYPEEFQALTQDVIKRSQEHATPAELDDAILTDLIEAGKRHRKDMLQAPHDALAAYRGSEIKVIEALRSVDPQLCAGYIVTGAVRTNKSTSADQTMVDFRSVSWETFAAGRDRPANRTIKAPGEDAWKQIEQNMRAGGLAPATVTTFFDDAALRRATPQLQCQAGLAFFRAINDLPGTAGDDVYAFLVSRNV